MKFGLFFTMDHYDHMGLSPEQHLQNTVLQVQAAEAAGFETAWFTEQHCNQMDGICSDPITLMAYAAAKTSKIRLGTAVSLPALYHPVRLAEAYALLDVMSGGRLDIGVGASTSPRPFELYGAPYELRRELRDKAIDTMLSLWGGERPSLTEPGTIIAPAQMPLSLYPLQKPHPPIWVATGTLDRVTTIFECGHSVLIDYLFCDFDAAQVMARKQFVPQTSHQPAQNAAAVIYTQFVDEDVAYRHFQDYYEVFLQRLRGPGFQLRGAWDELQRQGHILCCTPSTALKRVDRVIRQGLDQLIMGIDFGGIAHAEIVATIELLGRTILTEFGS